MFKTLFAAGLAVLIGSSASFAAEVAKKPVKMTEAQLDAVAAGQGCTLISCIDVEIEVERNEIVKNVSVAANAAVAVLGRATAGQGVRFNPGP